MEKIILLVLGFDLSVPTATAVLNLLSAMMELDKISLELARVRQTR